MRLIGLLLVAAIAGCDRTEIPRTYDECVLQGMRGVSSDVAAYSIREACRARFPIAQPQLESLPDDARRQLHGRAGLRPGGTFGGTLYNGNKDWTITQVTIRLTLKDQNGEKVRGSSRDYNHDLAIRPLSAADFSFNIGKTDKQYAWGIVAAQGHHQNVAAE